MAFVPIGQLMLSIYSWISMIVYIYLVCKLLQWRYYLTEFRSSYYLLFVLKFIADFYAFALVEFVMRPRKFNYFNLYSENMQALATFSVSNIIISRGILCSSHIIISLNRLTAFSVPLKQEQIWRNSLVFSSMFSLWVLFIVLPLPTIIPYRGAPSFSFTATGILQMSGGVIDEYNAIHGVVISVITVVICSICYVGAFLKVQKAEYKHMMVEMRIFLCALVSSLPFIFELVRSILLLSTFRLKNDLYKIMTDLWYFETEVLATSSVWLQLIINKRVKDLILNKKPRMQSRSQGTIVAITAPKR